MNNDDDDDDEWVKCQMSLEQGGNGNRNILKSGQETSQRRTESRGCGLTTRTPGSFLTWSQEEDGQFQIGHDRQMSRNGDNNDITTKAR